MLDIVYCCNDKYFEGLYLSILSILKRTNKSYRFTILTADISQINKSCISLSKYHIELLEKLIKSFNSENEIRVFDCTKRYLQAFGSEITKCLPYILLKLLIPECFDSGKVLYLDCDVMANGDASSIFDIDMKDVEICACHEHIRQHILKIVDSQYFSDGVLLINIDQIKKTNLFDKAINLFNQNSHVYTSADALNKTSPKINFFPNEYAFNWQAKGIGSQTIFKHFAYQGQDYNIKQWDILGVQKILELNCWDSDYKYFINQKKTWEIPKQIYNVMYSCNDGIFDGLYLSIQSILLRSKAIFNFYILTADLSHLNPKYLPLSSKHIQALEKMIKSFNPNNQLTILDVKQKYIDTLGKNYDNKEFTPYALFRLLIDQFAEIEGLMLYLDVDTLANGDITEVWNTDMNCVEICVSRDKYLNDLRKVDMPVFNSGVMLINLDFIRITRYFNKALKYLICEKPIMADQEALYHTWYRIKSWKDEYRFNYQEVGILPNVIIKHFVRVNADPVTNRVIRPWDIEGVKNILKLNNWDKDYELFLETKKAWY